MKINGNVTISLDDYDVLRSEFKSATRMKESLKRTSKELGVFLSFIWIIFITIHLSPTRIIIRIIQHIKKII